MAVGGLALADGVSLNHEDAAMVTVTVTVTDDGDPAMSASTDVTITVNDVNEGPDVTGMAENVAVAAVAGQELDAEIDLTSLFVDPDGGDDIVRWEMTGNPGWLAFTVQFSEEDGNEMVTGHLTGTPLPGDDSETMVTITATDRGGETGTASFYVVVDDGNDEITSINLYHLNDDGTDGDKNYSYTVDVDENHAGEVNLGRVTVDDLDSSESSPRPAPGHGDGRPGQEFRNQEGPRGRLVAGEKGRCVVRS